MLLLGVSVAALATSGILWLLRPAAATWTWAGATAIVLVPTAVSSARHLRRREMGNRCARLDRSPRGRARRAGRNEP